MSKTTKKNTKGENMEKYNGMADDGIIGMLWVVILMASMVVTVVGKKMNERRRMRIGVELELVKKHRLDGVDPNHSIANWLKLRGFEAERASYGSDTVAHTVKVQPDNSLPSGGFEIVSMPLYDGTHRKWLRKIFDAIKGITKITRECSSHIHVGLKSHGSEWGQDGTITYNEAMAIAGNTAYAYSYFEKGIDTIVSDSRRHGNSYCREMNHVVQSFPTGLVKSWTNKTWNDETASYDEEVTTYTPSEVSVMIYEHTRGSRYYKLNTQALNKHGTLEFRQHQAVNFDSTKLNNWIQLCYEITMRCADEASMLTIKEYPRTLDGLFGFLGMKDNSLHNYFKSRATILAGGMLNTACTTCGKYTCMEDNRCSTIADSESNWSDFEESARTVTSPSYFTCDECSYEHDSYNTHNRRFDHDRQTWVATIDDECFNCETYNPSATGYYPMSAIGLGLVLMFPLMSAIALLVGCGIGAIHGAAKKFNAKTRFRKLWAALSSRGNQAAGMAFQTPESVMFLKDALSSEQLSHSVKTELDSTVEWAVCHTRFATHGDNNADNAHPHFSSSNRIILVHNGVVSNYLTVWKELNRPQTGPVDSQAIAECLEVGGIEKVVELCKGNMSLIWANRDDPRGTLKCWTNGGNPLHMGRLDDADTGAVVIASTKAHLDTMGARLVSDWACIIGREYTIHPDGNITKRDIEGSAKTVNAMVSWRSYARNNYWDNWNTPTKATGNADNCSIDNDGIDPDLLVQATNHVYTIMDDMGGWTAFKCEGESFHGYDALSHEGITNGGIRYKLPHGTDPTISADDMDSLICGDYYGGNDLYNYYGIYDNWQ